MAAVVVAFLLLVGWGVTVERPQLAASNALVSASGIAITIPSGDERCQSGEFVPAGAGFLRTYARFEQLPGTLSVEVRDAQGRTVSRGARRAADNGPIMVEIEEIGATVSRGQVCFTNTGDGAVSLAGNLTPLNPQTAVGPQSPGAGPGDEIRADFYFAEHRTVLDLASDVAERFSLFKPSFVDRWVFWVVLGASIVAPIGGGVLLLSFHRRGRVRAAVLAGVTLVIGASWATTTPAYQVPDELVHVGYAEYLSDHLEMPPLTDYDRRKVSARADDHSEIYYGIPFSVEGKPSWDPAEDRLVDSRLRADLPTSHPSAAGSAAGGPPGYYVIPAAIAALTDSWSALDRMFAMRLASLAIAIATVLLVHGFLRETFPHRPLPVAIGTLGVAIHPVFTFLAGGVSNDNLLFLLAAALLRLMARVMRRGPTVGSAVLLGVVLGAGELTKSRSILMLPATLLGLSLVVLASDRGRRLRSAGLAGLALLVFAAIEGTWITLNRTVLQRDAATTTSVASDASDQLARLGGVLSYVWQSFLPRLPFMEDHFTDWPQYPLWDVYIEGFIGRFGWYEYGFASWVNVLGFVVLVTIAGGACAALLRHRDAVRARWVELVTYLAYGLTLPIFLAVAGVDYRDRTGYNLEQTRYIFPLLALYAGAVALAIVALPKRWRPLGAGVLTGLFAVHSAASFLLTIDRYYL